MVKIVVARCDEHGCDKIAGEWLYKQGDRMEGRDYCAKHRG